MQWLQTQQCLECWTRDMAERNRRMVREMAQAHGLPELSGTDKQVNWAMAIRQYVVADLDAWVEDEKARMERRQAEPAEYRNLERLRRRSMTRIRSITRAGWWINHREPGQGREAVVGQTRRLMERERRRSAGG